MSNVLIIDDDYEIAEMYAASLRKHGHYVIESDSAQTALDALENHPVDVVVMDIILPHHNGLSFLHELRSYTDWLALPVIITSSIPAGYVGLSRRHQKRFGIVNYLDKTDLVPSALAAEVENLLNNPV